MAKRKDESQALVTYDGKPTALVPRNMTEALEMSKLLSQSAIIPGHFRGKPADVFVALQFGAELGMPPMASLRNVHVVDGKPGLAAQAAQGVCLAQPDCEGFYRIESECKDGEIAVWECKRRGQPHRGKFTLAQAKQAGLLEKKGPWQQYPDDMLNNRAIMRAARRAYPDKLGGIYSDQEIIEMHETERDTFVAPAPASSAPVSSAPAIIDAEIVQDERGNEVITRAVSATTRVARETVRADVAPFVDEHEPDPLEDEGIAVAAQLDADVARVASLIDTAQNEAELELVVPSCQTIKNRDIAKGKKLLERYLAKRGSLRAPKGNAQPEVEA